MRQYLLRWGPTFDLTKTPASAQRINEMLRQNAKFYPDVKVFEMVEVPIVDIPVQTTVRGIEENK